jgi:hypothetical protein
MELAQRLGHSDGGTFPPPEEEMIGKVRHKGMEAGS